jgi:hypothetical protein
MDEPSPGYRSLKRAGIFSLFFLLFFVVSSAFTSEQESFRFKKEPELQQIRPKKTVKIKLKRTAKDEYSWELAGDDVDEIIKADRRLRQQLHLPGHAR